MPTWCARTLARELGIAMSLRTVGRTVLFTAAPALASAVVKAQAGARLEERPAFFAKPKLLIVDELGYLPLALPRACSSS